MSSIDWKDSARRDVIHFQMVDPNNLDEVYGDLEDVQLGFSSITYGYYTDTRYSSGISFLKSNNYVPNAWIRIIHEVPIKNYSKELGTFIPTSPSESYKGAAIVTLDLQSPLWGLKEDLAPSKFSIGKKTSLLDAFARICETCNRPFIFENPNDLLTTKSIVYDAGESYLNILFDICDQTDNYMDLDGHGRIILSANVDHSTLTPLWELDSNDQRSVIIEGSISMETEVDDLPSRAIVIHNGIIGVADLEDGVSYSAHQRGYTKAQKYDSPDATTKAKAAAAAQSFLDEASKIVQWSMDCLYFPCKCGDNVIFTKDGVKHYCMIQSIDPLNLDTMTMTLSLKEVFYNE